MPTDAPAPHTAETRITRGRRRRSLGIQSKLLIMLLLVSVISIAVTGVIGYINGRESLTESAYEQLTTIRELRAYELETVLETIQTGVVLDSRTTDVVEASAAFNDAFEELDSLPLNDDELEKLHTFYDTSFIPELEQRSGQEYDTEALQPYSDGGQRLQLLYTTLGTDYDEKLAITDAGDGSAWSTAHAAHHRFFQGLIDDLGYEDVLLTNMQGQVVYSAYKGTDLGLNLFDAPTNETALGVAVKEALTSNSLDTVVVTDFERWIPSLNVPTAWIVSPVGREGALTGTLAVQVPIQTINDTLTGEGQWKAQGLGDTGEVYIVGADHLMRSTSRALTEDPDSYAAKVIANGTAPELAERIVQVGGTVLLQPIRTPPVDLALRGESGTMLTTGYTGEHRLASFTPVEFAGLQWVIIASIDQAEAFAPVDAFTRTVLLSAALLVLIVAVLALLLSRVFTAPLDKLMRGVRRVAAGERDVEVDTRTRDEFAELGAAFNGMSKSLQTKADLLDAERAESERMLLSLMPAAVAARYRQGDENIAEDHHDVTVIYADIHGFDEFTSNMDSGRSIQLLNEIMTGFDNLASDLGIERVRTTKQGYLASCGLTLPRVDSARRVVEFAAGAQALVARLSSQWGADLALQAGIDSGSVTSGIVGRNSVVYDMWGDAVNLAYRLQGTGKPGVMLSQDVVDRLGDMFPLQDAGTISARNGDQRAWMLVEEHARG